VARARRKEPNGATLGFEATLWAAADKLRGHIDAAAYKHVVLFVDARSLGSLVTRTHRELSDEEIARIAETYYAWRERTPTGTVPEGDCPQPGLPRGLSPKGTVPSPATPTSLASARAPRWTRSAATATSSRRAATSALRRRRTTASRSSRGWSG